VNKLLLTFDFSERSYQRLEKLVEMSQSSSLSSSSEKKVAVLEKALFCLDEFLDRTFDGWELIETQNGQETQIVLSDESLGETFTLEEVFQNGEGRPWRCTLGLAPEGARFLADLTVESSSANRAEMLMKALNLLDHLLNGQLDGKRYDFRLNDERANFENL